MNHVELEDDQMNDEDMLEVVGLEPDVDGLAREATVGEGEPG